MAKVLISLLGTGRAAKGDTDRNRYEIANYVIGDSEYKNESFVSSAIIKHYKIDKLFLIGTKGSMWDEIANLFNADDDCYAAILERKVDTTLSQEDIDKLNQYIDARLGSVGSKCLIVPDGENDSEVWQTFELFYGLFDLLNSGDKLYFDITHGFRSQSVLSFIMSQFGQTYKNYKIGGILYGKLINDKPSPIIDLKMYYEFLEWSKAIKNLRNYGNGSDLKKMIEASGESQEIKNAIVDFTNALSIADIGAMQSSIKVLKGKIKLFEQSNNPIMKIVSVELLRFTEEFGADEPLSRFLFKLTKWYANNSNYAMAYLVLSEAVVSAVREHECLADTTEGNKLAKMSIYRKKEISKIYRKVSAIRNNIAHKTAHQVSLSKSINEYKYYYDALKKIYEV
ncbi:CRISPR-associated protein [Campylobacterota bacterium]|nr:CRISPR-associated protein [Campylobacterota bacterium]